MRIDTVSAVNFKSKPTFSYKLGAVSVVIGDNFRNKTAILQAIQLGLLGWVPGGIPKTNAGIFSLSCGGEMSVELTFSDGRRITRGYEQKGETVKALALEPADGFEVPDCLLDVSSYLNSSPRERLKYVFGMVDVSADWTGKRIMKAVGETQIDCEQAMTEAVVLAKKTICDRLSESHFNHDGSVQDWLEGVVNDLRERVKTTNAALGRMEKYSQAAVELRTGGNDLDAANVDRTLRDKRLALQEVSAKLAVAKAQQATTIANAATKREIEQRLKEPFDAAAIENARRQVYDLEAAAVEAVDLGDLAFKVAEARATLEAHKQLLKGIQADFKSVERNYQLDLKSPKCPHCGTGGQKFKSAVKKQYEARCLELNVAKVNTESDIGISDAIYKAAQSLYEQAAIADKKAQRDRLLLQSLKSELNRLECLVLNRDMWQKQLAGLKVEAVDQTALQTMAATVQTLQQEINSLSDAQKRWVAQAHEAKRASEAKSARQNLEAELCALRAITKALEAVQSSMVSEAFSKILSDVNRLTTGILLSAVEYHEGEIGRWGPNHVWIPNKSWSGTEQLIACAGISVALARQSPIRLILMDELGRLTPKNKTLLVERLLTLVAESFIDQCILIDVTDEPYKNIPGVNLISV